MVRRFLVVLLALLCAARAQTSPVITEIEMDVADIESWADTEGLEGSNQMFRKQLVEAQAGNGSSLVIYGDSILACMQFESWGCEGAQAVRDRRFSEHKPLVWAVGGDSVESVMGKMLTGVVPTDVGRGNASVVVAINIGHNGMGTLGGGVEVTVEKIKAIAQYVLAADPANEVVWISMLPSSSQWVGSGLYAPSKFLDASLYHFANATERMHFANCEPMFLAQNDTRFTNTSLLPDTVHLGPMGYDVLADCLEPFLADLTGTGTGPSMTGVEYPEEQPLWETNPFVSPEGGMDEAAVAMAVAGR